MSFLSVLFVSPITSKWLWKWKLCFRISSTNKWTTQNEVHSQLSVYIIIKLLLLNNKTKLLFKEAPGTHASSLGFQHWMRVSCGTWKKRYSNPRPTRSESWVVGDLTFLIFKNSTRASWKQNHLIQLIFSWNKILENYYNWVFYEGTRQEFF